MRTFTLFTICLAVAGCRACVTLERPLSFPCNPDASTPGSECPQAFRRGLEGRCHALDAGAPYTCRQDSDCEGAWRCGLEGQCHERDAGADYLCTTDTQCEAQWRCGPTARCVDSTHDALEPPAAGFGPPQVQLLFPDVPVGNGAVGASPRLYVNVTNDAGCRVGIDVRSFSWERKGVLTKHVDFPNGIVALPPGLGDGDACENLQLSATQRTVDSAASLPASVVALADTALETTALLADGQLCRLRLDPTLLFTAPLECRSPFNGAKPTHLKSTAPESDSDDSAPGYLAWSDSQLFWLHDFRARLAGPFTIPDGGIADALGVRLKNATDDGLIAVTPDAVHLARWDGATLRAPDGGAGRFGSTPIADTTFFGFHGPDRALAHRSGLLYLALGDSIWVGSRNASANTPLVDFGDFDVWYRETKLLSTCERDDANESNLDLSLSPAAFPDGFAAITRCNVKSGRLLGRHEAVSLSQYSAGPPQVQQTLNNISDIDTSPAGAWFFVPQLRVGNGNPARTAWADALGRLWLPDDDLPIIEALVPDAVPSWVGGDSALIKVGTAPVNWVSEKAGDIGAGFLGRGAWAVSPDGGFSSGLQFSNVGTVGAVRGLAGGDIIQLPPNIFSRNVFVGGFTRVYAATSDFDTVRPPLDVSLYERDGARHLVWRSFDTVWLLTVDEAADAGIFDLDRLPEPQRRLTPLVNQAITSLAFTDGADAGHFADGYLVAGPRLFSFSALNPRLAQRRGAGRPRRAGRRLLRPRSRPRRPARRLAVQPAQPRAARHALRARRGPRPGLRAGLPAGAGPLRAPPAAARVVGRRAARRVEAARPATRGRRRHPAARLVRPREALLHRPRRAARARHRRHLPNLVLWRRLPVKKTLLLLALAASSTALAEKAKLAVMSLRPAGGLDEQVASAMTDAVATEANARGFFEVMSSNDIATLLGVQRQKQLLGCSEDSGSCLAELAGALGARFVLSGSVAKLGDVFQLTLSTVDSKSAQPIGRSTRLAKDLAALRAQLPYAVAEATATPLPAPPSRVLPFTLLGIGAAALIAGGVVGFTALSSEGAINRELQNGEQNPEALRRLDAYQRELDVIGLQRTVALVSLIAGVAFLAGGFFFMPSDPNAGARAALVPTPNGLALAGLF
ncbi:MAG: hypothetical protein IPJ65_29720 [Archangiaceae bacterium]|nr:hypothetical protein [Archangiaceae bacterium]